MKLVPRWGTVRLSKDGCLQNQEIHNPERHHLGMHLITYEVFHTSSLCSSI